MKKKNSLVIIAGLFSASCIAILFHSFHQEVPKNTIRILIEKPVDEHNLRIEPLIRESSYRYVSHGEDFELIHPDPSRPILHFQVVRDENTRALIFLKEDADILYDNLSIAKTEWIRKKVRPEQIRILSRSGDAISQLALNGENPLLQDASFRKTLAQALPLKLWMNKVFSGWVEEADPDLLTGPESSFAPTKEITLRYLTTPSREGQQLAYLTREALKKIGIRIEIFVYEPALFYAKIKKRDFDLYSSTSLPGIKNILDLPHTLLIPLFRWKHALIMNPRVKTPKDIEESFDYSFRFLSSLQLQ